MGSLDNVVAPQGWQATLSLDLQSLQQRTVLRHAHSGPLRIQRPFYPEGPVCHMYLVHPPAGVVGGDDLRVTLHSGEDSAALVTTPGATQFYRSAGETAFFRQHLDIEQGATLDWLPQENIYFDGAMVEVETTIKLQADSRIIAWDTHSLGRPAASERFESGRVCINQRIERDGVPLLRERIVVGAPNYTDAAAGFRGHAINATLVATPVQREQLDEARDLLATLDNPKEPTVALTLIDDLLVARYLGDSTQQSKQLFEALWHMLRPHVHQLPACPPRIWAT